MIRINAKSDVLSNELWLLQGDSGGPIICKNEEISGIIIGSGTHKRCDDKYNPQIFLNVWFYKKWIDSKMK